MALKTTGVVVPLEQKLLIVGDSVMGCLSSAGDGDASPDAFSYLGQCAPCSANKPSPKRVIRVGNPGGLFLPAMRPVLPCVMSKDRDIDGRDSARRIDIKLRDI